MTLFLVGCLPALPAWDGDDTGAPAGDDTGVAGGSLADADRELTGVDAGDDAGRELALHDLDGDGAAEVIVGAPRRDGAEADAGIVYLVRGSDATGTLALDASDREVAGESEGASFGHAVAGGDLNGDGRGDVLGGQPGLDLVVGPEVTPDAGSVQVLFSAAEGGQTIGFPGTSEGQQTGWAIAALGDASGDDLDDVSLGAPGAGDDAGVAAIVRGSTSLMDLQSGLSQWSGEAPGDRAGEGVAPAGDTDGDGLADVLVAAPHADAVYLLRDPPPGDHDLADADAHLTADPVTGSLAATDLDGDGSPELFVGTGESVLVLDASLETILATLLGGDTVAAHDGVVAIGGDAVWVLAGGVAGTVALDDVAARWEPEAAGDEAGAALALGDVDGDGALDLAVGAPGRADGAGAVYLLYGAVP
ncbi:MAG: FG-GAP repeat domain-containing protein [Myxococcota bacterium]